jgi:MFS family permease
MAAGTIGDVKLLAPLRERDFALLWTGMTVSLLGDGIFIVAEAWQVYDIHNDPVALSLVGLAWTGGMTAFLLTGGIISDRVERRRVLIAADLARAAVLAVTGALSLAGVLEIWHLVALAVSIGLTPVSFALTGPVSKAIGVDATLVVAGAAPMLVCVVLYAAAGLRRDEELHPLLPTPAIP